MAPMMVSSHLKGLGLLIGDLPETGDQAAFTKQGSEWTIELAGNMSLNGKPICGDAGMPNRASSNT